MRLVLCRFDRRLIAAIASAVSSFIVNVTHSTRAVVRSVLHKRQPCRRQLLAQPEKFVALAACPEVETFLPCLTAQDQRFPRQIHHSKKPLFRWRGIQIVCRVAEIFECWRSSNRRPLNFGCALPCNSAFIHFLPQFKYPPSVHPARAGFPHLVLAASPRATHNRRSTRHPDRSSQGRGSRCVFDWRT